MRQIEFLVEEVSAEAALSCLLPKIIGSRADYRIHPFSGWNNLLKRLPFRFEGYRQLIRDGHDIKIVVLIDEDRDPEGCQKRKEILEDLAKAGGLVTKTVAPNGANFDVVNRIAVEELEAWFFGDLGGLIAAYPGVPTTI